MFDFDTFAKYRQLGEYIRGLQEVGPADEEVGNRLQRASDELAQVERLALQSRAKVAEGMRAARGALRELGIAVPALTRPPSSASGARPRPGSDCITYSAADAEPCIACGDEVGAGPIGWGTEPEPGPVCDDCLGDRTPLYLFLLIVNFVREMGEMGNGSEVERELAERALMAVPGHIEATYLRTWLPGKGLPEERLFRLLEEIRERNESAEESGAGDERAP